MPRTGHIIQTIFLVAAVVITPPALAQVAVIGKTVYTMAGPVLKDTVVIIRDGKIAEIRPVFGTVIPGDLRILRAEVVTPGLIDAHSVVGLTGIYNQKHDQDQLEHSAPIQPELRAVDAYNALEDLVAYVRGFGVTTVHTGHAPGELISGQTIVVKTAGRTVDEAVFRAPAMVAATLSSSARKKEKGKSPGTRGKMMALLRAEFVKVQNYLAKRESGDEEKRPPRDLRLETLGRVLSGEIPLLVTADRAQDIASALRLAREFGFKLVLDSAAESYLLVDAIKDAAVPVIVHPSMYRTWGDRKNLSFETAATLRHAGIRVALQSGYESYVPKTRVVLFEAAIAAANGLTFEETLATITIDAARILGVEDRVGSLELGKDGDVALYDGDPFEYTTHCVGVVIDGNVVSDTPR
ncbi:MAG: amidohydrolase family protein [Planctomycetes bacterium]|nr:amidohydrolase family protein [Planctomycetota bacterium]